MTTRRTAAASKTSGDATASKGKSDKTSAAAARKTPAKASPKEAPAKNSVTTSVKTDTNKASPAKRGRPSKQDKDSPRAKSIALTGSDDERSSVGSYDYDDGFMVRDNQAEDMEKDQLSTSQALRRMLTLNRWRVDEEPEDDRRNRSPPPASSSSAFQRRPVHPIDLTEDDIQHAQRMSFPRTSYDQRTNPFELRGGATTGSTAGREQADYTRNGPQLQVSLNRSAAQRHMLDRPRFDLTGLDSDRSMASSKSSPLRTTAFETSPLRASSERPTMRATPERPGAATVATFNTPPTDRKMTAPAPEPSNRQATLRTQGPTKIPFGFKDAAELANQEMVMFNVGLPTGEFAPNTIIIYGVQSKSLYAVRPANGATLQKGMPYYASFGRDGELKLYSKCTKISNDIPIPLLSHSLIYPETLNKDDLRSGVCLAGFVENIDEGVATIKSQQVKFKELTVIGLTTRWEFFRSVVTLWGNQINAVQPRQFECFLFLNVKQSLFKNAIRFNAGESSAVICLAGVESARLYVNATQYEGEQVGEGQLALPEELSDWQ